MAWRKRRSTDERREQIIQATLELLATHPLDRLTTRVIARRVGLTQPGLFRHFRSRDDLLTAAVESARRSLADHGQGIIEVGHPPVAALEALVRGVFQFAANHPGLPRLLFHEIGSLGDNAFHRSLRLLLSTQHALLSALVQSAADAGQLPANIDASRAAELGLAAIQGLLLKAQTGALGSLPEAGDALVAHWIAGLRAGEPALAALPEAAPEAGREPGVPLLEIDVRPILEQGTDPAGQILASVERLAADGALEIIAPFRPAPLMALLAARQLRVSSEQNREGLWTVTVLGAAAPEVVDLRELEPPTPLERVLAVSADLAPGSGFLCRLPRQPRLLLPHLRQRGLLWHIQQHDDETVLMHIRRES